MKNTIELNDYQAEIAELFIEWYEKMLVDDSSENQAEVMDYADKLACSLGMEAEFEYEDSILSAYIYDSEEWVTLEF